MTVSARPHYRWGYSRKLAHEHVHEHAHEAECGVWSDSGPVTKPRTGLSRTVLATFLHTLNALPREVNYTGIQPCPAAPRLATPRV